MCCIVAEAYFRKPPFTGISVRRNVCRCIRAGAGQLNVKTVRLSKRTDLYVVGTGINNGAATAHTADAATGAGPATSNNKDVRALQIGMRHRF